MEPTMKKKRNHMLEFINSSNVQHVEFKDDYRCPVCKRLLMRGEIVVIEIRCPKCKRMVTMKA